MGMATHFWWKTNMSDTGCMKTDGDGNVFLGGKVTSDTGCMKPDGDGNIFLGGKVTCQTQAV